MNKETMRRVLEIAKSMDEYQSQINMFDEYDPSGGNDGIRVWYTHSEESVAKYIQITNASDIVDAIIEDRKAKIRELEEELDRL